MLGLLSQPAQIDKFDARGSVLTDIGPANSRQTAVIDQTGAALADVSGNIVGIPKPFWGERLVWCASLSVPDSVARRYQPSHPPAETCNFGMDFSMVAPFGVQIVSGTLTVWFNTATPTQSADWTIGPVTPRGRALYALLTGGVEGTDYILRWTAVDGNGNSWPRSALVLCAETS